MKYPLKKSRFLSTILSVKRGGVQRKTADQARCNLCGRLYRVASQFQRFCRSCRMGDELFKFAEWLPQS
jgi:hypothetical protein